MKMKLSIRLISFQTSASHSKIEGRWSVEKGPKWCRFHKPLQALSDSLSALTCQPLFSCEAWWLEGHMDRRCRCAGECPSIISSELEIICNSLPKPEYPRAPSMTAVRSCLPPSSFCHTWNQSRDPPASGSPSSRKLLPALIRGTQASRSIRSHKEAKGKQPSSRI